MCKVNKSVSDDRMDKTICQWLCFAPFPTFQTQSALSRLIMLKHASHPSLRGADGIKSERTDFFKFLFCSCSSHPCDPMVALNRATTALACCADKRGVKETPRTEQHFQGSRASRQNNLSLYARAFTCAHVRLTCAQGVVLMDGGSRGCCNRVSHQWLRSQMKGPNLNCSVNQDTAGQCDAVLL